MFDFFRNRRIKKYVKEASDYVEQKYTAPFDPTEIRYCLSENKTDAKQQETKKSLKTEVKHQDKNIDLSKLRHSTVKPRTYSNGTRYSLQKKKPKDPYNASEVVRMLRNYSDAGNFNEMIKTLEANINQTFVDRLLFYINEKGVKDSEVYKAAQVDKRLFSKMVSNREYKPSKDTAVALALALELSLNEANDMLSRAGYAFSHSNKRDIIIEFLFREKIYNLIDANDILYRLRQKLIGRF